MDWVDDVEETLKPYLKALINDTHFNKKAFIESKNKGNAQLWVALASLYKRTVTLENRIKLFEKTLQEIGKK